METVTIIAWVAGVLFTAFVLFIFVIVGTALWQQMRSPKEMFKYFAEKGETIQNAFKNKKR